MIGMHLARLSLPNVQVGAFLTGWVAFSHLYVEDFFLKAEETRELFLIGKNRIEDSRFFHSLKKRAFPFFRQTIVCELRQTLN